MLRPPITGRLKVGGRIRLAGAHCTGALEELI
jgi:hypothetical protein